VVRHPAGLAAIRVGDCQGQAEALTPEQARWLVSAAGGDAVAAAQSLDLSAAGRLRTAEAVRRAHGPDLGPLVLEQALLRERARDKHPRGGELWWTGPALEQASSYDVAVHRAARYPGPVVDLCCSVGGDLLALPDGSVGVDLDEARLVLARANAEVLGRGVGLVRADATTLPLPEGADLFCDPARRAGGRRVFDPRDYTPPLGALLARRAAGRFGVKVAPGIDYAALPADLEVEVVSLRGEVKEAVLWGGAARTGAARTATLLPGGAALSDTAVADPAVREPGRYLLEPDGAVVRAHLVAQVAALVDGWLVDATIAYVMADQPAATPYGRWFEVLEVLPFGLKALRERLRAHDAGPLVVKKRGTAVEPDTLRRQLKLTGTREVTVVLTRARGRQVAMIVRPLPTTDAGGRAPW
jgi:SAM-dependent methyltransferase